MHRQNRTKYQHRQYHVDDQAGKDPEAPMHRVVHNVSRTQQARRYQEAADSEENDHRKSTEIQESRAKVEQRIVSDIRILKSAAVVQEHHSCRDKPHVIETGPPEGVQIQSVVDGQAHTSARAQPAVSLSVAQSISQIWPLGSGGGKKSDKDINI
jgi:hypothetical protein